MKKAINTATVLVTAIIASTAPGPCPGQVGSGPPAAGGAFEHASARRGVVLGIQLVGDRIGVEDPGENPPPDHVFVDEHGSGFALRAGYSFTPSFGLILALVGAAHDATREELDVRHSTATLEAHYRFLPEERVRPFLYGGVGGASLLFQAGGLETRADGGVAVVGAGMIFDLSRHAYLDLAARLDLINWDRVSATWRLGNGDDVRIEKPVEDDGSAAKVLFGLSWVL